MTRSRSRQLLFIFKLIVTIGLCAFIFVKVDWNESWSALRKTSPLLLSVVFAGMLLNIMTSTLKWKILLLLHGIRFPLSQLYRYYLIGSFFNNFLPSTIGGDGYRIIKTMSNPVSKSGALASVFIERITGLLAMLVTGFIGALVSYLQTGNEMAGYVVLWGSCFLSAVIVVALGAFLAPKSFIAGIRGRIPDKFARAFDCFHDYRGRRKEALYIAMLSLFFQCFLLALYVLLISDVTGRYVSIFEVSVAVSLSTLVSLLPISINGIGLLDGSFIYVLQSFHVGYEQAVIVMILMRLLGYLQSLIGGVLYFFEKRGTSRCGILSCNCKKYKVLDGRNRTGE